MPRASATPPTRSRPPSEPPGAAVAAGAVLVVTAGNAIGRRLDLADELVIGRAAEGEGRLGDDLALSRRHARVTRSASGEVTIEDLGSANGTFVNGERVRDRRVLTLGDSIRLGSTTMELAGSAERSRRNRRLSRWRRNRRLSRWRPSRRSLSPGGRALLPRHCLPRTAVRSFRWGRFSRDAASRT